MHVRFIGIILLTFDILYENRSNKLRAFFLLFLMIFALAACGGDDDSSTAIQELDPVTANDLQIVTGQTIFVPAYSEIFHTDSRTINLTVTLAVHNTDSEHPIIIQSVRYYDTDGDLVRDYVDAPLLLNPLATTGFVVDEGGFGANFIVEWVAEQPVFEPVVEAIMIHTGNQQGLSLITTGRIVAQIEADGE
jgi:hypothetical protein